MHYKIFTQSKELAFIVLSITLMTCSSFAIAGSKVLPIDGMKYTINASIMDNLIALTGKKVTLTLDSGKVFTGRLKSVGEHLVHLEKIERKEFFDALIKLENIQAIEAQFRSYQR